MPVANRPHWRYHRQRMCRIQVREDCARDVECSDRSLRDRPRLDESPCLGVPHAHERLLLPCFGLPGPYGGSGIDDGKDVVTRSLPPESSSSSVSILIRERGNGERTWQRGKCRLAPSSVRVAR